MQLQQQTQNFNDTHIKKTTTVYINENQAPIVVS